MTAPAGFVRQPGDGWVDCSCGGRHWGLSGAAGLFLVRRSPTGKVREVVLQHRSLNSHQGGTWGIPGGALRPGEPPADGALREAHEEAGISGGAVRVIGTHLLDHGPWRYTTILAEQRPGTQLDVRATDTESIKVAWVPVTSVPTLPLLPAFAKAWPALLTAAEAANG